MKVDDNIVFVLEVIDRMSVCLDDWTESTTYNFAL